MSDEPRTKNTRIYTEDLPRLVRIQRELTVLQGGKPAARQDALRYLLDFYEREKGARNE